ncbi:MAG: NADP-dependent phosphogluconate dehydrogenase [Anaerolineae bacterium]
MTKQADIGIVGLGIMGRMLALNMERNDYTVAGYDLDAEKIAAFEAQRPHGRLIGCRTSEAFLEALARPRRILMMVPSGRPVDAVIEAFKVQLEAGDLLIDGGNSFFKETERRARALETRGILYLGMGVSGGEQGALWGPSLMPGGPREGWTLMQSLLEAIAARVDGEPCVTYIGPGGAGHYVKMVHNGIEYAVMQLIAETYDLLHRVVGLTRSELHERFAAWNESELASYLVEITADIFNRIDEETGKPLLDMILDAAKQKGTGKWTSQSAMDVGTPVPTISAAVEARVLSSYKEQRQAASKVLRGPDAPFTGDREVICEAARDALYAATLCAYAQGFALLCVASAEYGYHLNYGDIAKIWRGGCIIRAAALELIRAAFARDPEIPNLLVDAEIGQRVAARQRSLRSVVQLAVEHGVPAPALGSALAYFDGYRTARLPANLIQAQRDYFGAHTYQRVDKPGTFHTDWERDL